jgi:hypothetical protein
MSLAGTLSLSLQTGKFTSGSAMPGVKRLHFGPVMLHRISIMVLRSTKELATPRWL